MSLHFEELGQLFDQLLTAAQPTLSEQEREEIHRFTNVGEYQLAL
jgi:hypothetical protein